MLAFARVFLQMRRGGAFSQQLGSPGPAAAVNRSLRLSVNAYPGLRPGSRNIWFPIVVPSLPTPFPPPPPPPIVMIHNPNNDDIYRDNFVAAFPGIVKDLTDTGHYLDVPDVTNWIEKVLKYNVPGGKMNRGLTLVLSYRMLCPPSEFNDENLQLTYVLGWCVEILQTFQLVLDDIMDCAITRRGRLCWYRHCDTGLIAINDGILLEQVIYQLLYKYFKDKPYYTHILDLFHDVTMKSSMGQCLDMLIANSFKFGKFEKFTMKNYAAIVKYKTAYYSFFLPVCLVMRMVNLNDSDIFQQVKTILLEMGHFFQVQDDFLDCFGDPEVIGKIGTDIEDGKCSWLAVVALQKANPQQKIILEENYGINDPANVAVIKDLYEQLNLSNAFHLYEEESHNTLHTHIKKLPQGPLQDLFFKLLKNIYKRKF